MAKTIAWIDDDTDILYPVVEPLEEAGYHIDTFRTAAEALANADQIREADLILLDMLIPAGRTPQQFDYYTGRDLLQRLRDEHRVKAPVIILTVVNPDELRPLVAGMNVAAILRKDLLPTDLEEHVESALQAEGP